MEANLGLESAKYVPQYGYLQNGNSGDNPIVLEDKGVGHVAGLQRCILPHLNCPKVKKVSQVLPVPSNLSVHSPALRAGHSSPGVHQGGQRSETHGSSKGYQDPPVPRRLVTESPFPGNLPTTYPDPLGGMKSGSLCALLWRLLSWCHPRGIVLRARHIPGRLNVIADTLSRHNQVIQTEWSLSQQVFNQLCSKWAQPLMDLFATRFNHKLPSFVSPVPDRAAWAVDALSLSWEHLDAYAFPPVSLIPQVISKLRDQGCHRMILIAPGWPNMPWFWDLVDLSVKIPFSLPLIRDLVTQPFNGLLHRNLGNLNLHAWLLEALPSGNTVSLRRWQRELRLLRGAQPELCTSQSGPFLSNGLNQMRWTSGRPL